MFINTSQFSVYRISRGFYRIEIFASGRVFGFSGSRRAAVRAAECAAQVG